MPAVKLATKFNAKNVQAIPTELSYAHIEMAFHCLTCSCSDEFVVQLYS
jgi:hypothetical protein